MSTTTTSSPRIALRRPDGSWHLGSAWSDFRPEPVPWGGDRYPCAPGCHTGIAVLTPLGWQGLQARHPARFFHFLVARTALDGRGTEFLGWRVGYLPPAAPDRPAARPVIRFIPPPHRPGTV